MGNQEPFSIAPTNLILKQKSLWWQVTTILVTSGIFAGTITIAITLIFIFVFRAADLFTSSIALKTITYLCGIVPGLFFGISYIITKTELDDKRTRKICIWLAVVSFLGFVLYFSIDNVFWGVLKLILIPVIVYLFSRHVFSRADNIKQSFLGEPRAIRNLELISLTSYALIILLFPALILIAGWTNHLSVLKSILPLAPTDQRQKFETQINEYEKNQAEMVRATNPKLLRGESTVNKLNLYYQIRGRYPESLADNAIQITEEEIQFEKALGPPFDAAADVGLQDFSYQLLNNGQDFNLCTEALISAKCWEGSRGLLMQ